MLNKKIVHLCDFFDPPYTNGVNYIFCMQNKQQFIDVIKENEGIIYKVARIYSLSKEDQKDLYQEIIYQLWKSFESFKGDSKISTWMYRVALNTSIAHLKQQKNNSHKVSIYDLPIQLVDEPDTLMEERTALLYAQIKALNEVDKAIILLFLEEKSYDEMARITGLSTTNIGTRLGRIKQKLKSEMT